MITSTVAFVGFFGTFVTDGAARLTGDWHGDVMVALVLGNVFLAVLSYALKISE